MLLIIIQKYILLVYLVYMLIRGVMMNKWFKRLFFGLIMVLITVGYTYYFRLLVDDELYNFGFSFNIIQGLIPYKDFNMIVPPLFSYLLAGFFLLFGCHLLVYHFVIAIMIVFIFFISYRSFGNWAFIIYLLLLIYPYTGYNVFVLFLLFLLFYLKDRDDFCFWEPILISMMFLTKQTLGLLVIPSLIYSKNKKKTIAVYLIFIFSFLLYLVWNGMVFQFFDYCLFGMFDFASENSTSFNFLLLIEIFIILVLGYLSYVTKRKDYFFCLMFQIMALPIVNCVHFVISFIPVVYLFLEKYRDNRYVLFLCFVGVCSFFIGFNGSLFIKDSHYKSISYYDRDNFMSGRVIYNITENYIDKAKEYVDLYEGYNVYFFGSFAYMMKLNCGIPITKYDIINDGNMGYHGDFRYIKEIDDYCEENKCLFIINDHEGDDSSVSQTNIRILDYVKDNYYQVYSSNIFSVYINL